MSESERKLVACNFTIFIKDGAPAVYPWLLEKLGRGEGLAILERHEEGAVDESRLLPEIVNLFEGVESTSMNLVCRQYCWEYGRREVFGLFRRFNDHGHQCMLVTSLPQEICTEFFDLTRISYIERDMFVASQVLTGGNKFHPKNLDLVNRNSRKNKAIDLIQKKLKNDLVLSPYGHGWKRAFTGWGDVLVIGQSLTDIPLGKMVQGVGGRFVAFHPKDTDIMKVVDHTYGDTCTLERAFRVERLLVN